MAESPSQTTILVANGAGFLGDQPGAPQQLARCVEFGEGRPAYLTLEYLAELTMSILARRRQKDPSGGYAEDFLTALAELLDPLAARPHVRLVTNAGGANPEACVRAAAKLLCDSGFSQWRLGCVSGDDLLPRLSELQAAGVAFKNLDTDEPLASIPGPVVSAHAYLGARPIAEALAAEARIVITGRVADASLTLGPAVHEFGWTWNDYERLAAASTAGHLIECGAQVTGGYRTAWREQELAEIGYPIAEISAEGGVTITKPVGTAGRVDTKIVAEQLLYEIGDPAAYHTPDVTLNFRHVELEAAGPDRVAVRGAQGNPPPDSYKVSLAWHSGYTAAGMLLVVGPDAVEKARTSAEIVFARMASAGFSPERRHVELFGAERELMLRIAVEDPRRECVERFARELAPLITSGPAGLAGYAAGRPQVRPVFAYWPTLVPRELVEPRVEIRTAAEWSQI